MQAKACAHNVVNGETATEFILACLRQRVLAPTAMAKLRARLLDLSELESGEGAAVKRIESDRSKLAAMVRKLATVGRNMALAETPEAHQAMAAVFRELQSEIARHQAQAEVHQPPKPASNSAQEVEAAMAGLDQLVGLAKSEADQSAIGELFSRLEVQLYLRFRATEHGRRMVNEIGGGVVTFGSTPPASPLYKGPTDRAIIRQKLACGEPVSVVADPAVPCVHPPDPEVDWSANVKRGTLRCSGPRTAAMVSGNIKVARAVRVR